MSLLWRNVARSGHRVLLVMDDGPGAGAGLVPFLDIITHVEGVQLDDDTKSLSAVMSRRIDLATMIDVYNIKTRSSRRISMVRGAALLLPRTQCEPNSERSVCA